MRFGYIGTLTISHNIEPPMCIVDTAVLKMRETSGEPTTAVIRPRVVRPVQDESVDDGLKPSPSSPAECLGCFHDVCVPFAPSHLCQRNPGEPPPPTLDRDNVSEIFLYICILLCLNPLTIMDVYICPGI